MKDQAASYSIGLEGLPGLLPFSGERPKRMIF